MEASYIVVLVTVPTQEKADDLAKLLVMRKLAACVNRSGPVRSVYWWEGKIEEAEEYLLIIKTGRNKFSRLVEEIKNAHPYTVPEIVGLPIIEGNMDYLNWIARSLQDS